MYIYIYTYGGPRRAQVARQVARQVALQVARRRLRASTRRSAADHHVRAHAGGPHGNLGDCEADVHDGVERLVLRQSAVELELELQHAVHVEPHHGAVVPLLRREALVAAPQHVARLQTHRRSSLVLGDVWLQDLVLDVVLQALPEPGLQLQGLVVQVEPRLAAAADAGALAQEERVLARAEEEAAAQHLLLVAAGEPEVGQAAHPAGADVLHGDLVVGLLRRHRRGAHEDAATRGLVGLTPLDARLVVRDDAFHAERHRRQPGGRTVGVRPSHGAAQEAGQLVQLLPLLQVDLQHVDRRPLLYLGQQGHHEVSVGPAGVDPQSHGPALGGVADAFLILILVHLLRVGVPVLRHLHHAPDDAGLHGSPLVIANDQHGEVVRQGVHVGPLGEAEEAVDVLRGRARHLVRRKPLQKHAPGLSEELVAREVRELPVASRNANDRAPLGARIEHQGWPRIVGDQVP
mmetsp:Transcript_7473/g.22017  ORF Transcript_7473/g.22017 Transcript_7473/m.22017 type:complete len:462 (-) Transcript_7473:263-1648(-)